MSPAVLADLWKEEQERVKILEEKMKLLLREKQVMMWSIYTVSQKKLGHFFTAYNFRNIEQIFTKLGINHVLFMMNIMP